MLLLNFQARDIYTTVVIIQNLRVGQENSEFYRPKQWISVLKMQF